jgi:LacI family transcriptional regulator
LALPKPPDAIFSASDFAALGCLQELQAQGRRVPADCGLVGFSDEFFSQYTTPALSTVSQHCELLGRSAAQLLLQLRKENKAGPARHLKIQPALLARTSSLRPLEQ